MANLFRLEIIKTKPIREELDDISSSLDALPTSYLLPSNGGNKILLTVISDNFNIKYFANSSKYKKYVDNVLKEELGPLYVGIPGLYKAFFRGVEGLKEKCKEGDNPLYAEGGWRNWPKGAKECRLIILFLDFIKEYRLLKSNLNTNIALKAYRRFILGFTLYRSIMRFDPTILILDGKRYIKVRAPYIAIYREGDTFKTPLIIKDSWQYLEREKEGKLLRKAMGKEVVNMARYYYHKTVYIGGRDNNIYNIRKGLDIIRATNYKLEGLIIPLRPAKRSSSYAKLPPSKRTKALYKASSRAAILATLEEPSGVQGKTGIRAFIAIGNYKNTIKLAKLKSGLVSREGYFLNRIAKVNRLRKEKEDRALYSQIKDIL
ncbi:hypothetical protein V2W45_1471087 [Cenococcum geophilum]